MANAAKFYAVFAGHEPGLYTSWTDASKQVQGFKGAVYKSFGSRMEAILWLRSCVLAATEPVAEQIISLLKSEDLKSQVESETRNPNQIIIHTDGGASPNPGKGGYGIVLQKGRYRKELSAGYKLTTNNRMELLACIVALEALNETSDVLLRTDSKYVVDGITKNWAKTWRRRQWKKSDGKLAENIDLWSRLLDLTERHRVRFEWVRGHAGDIENERCDQLVTEARNKTSLLEDTGYKP